MNGKAKCRILKQIRAEIAAQNDIDLIIEECTHKGECRGTCPRCEEEVRFLERELEKRRALKKGVALAGISAGVTLALSGCSVVERAVDLALNPLQALGLAPKPTPEIIELMGEVPYYPPDVQGIIEPLNRDDGEPEPLEGEIAVEAYPEDDAACEAAAGEAAGEANEARAAEGEA